MSAIAPSQYPSGRAGETPARELDDQERDKLQEIHDLINLIMKELPVAAQAPAQQPNMSAASPYLYPLLQLSWRSWGGPFVGPAGFY
jgi:hypothetical protein